MSSIYIYQNNWQISEFYIFLHSELGSLRVHFVFVPEGQTLPHEHDKCGSLFSITS